MQIRSAILESDNCRFDRLSIAAVQVQGENAWWQQRKEVAIAEGIPASNNLTAPAPNPSGPVMVPANLAPTVCQPVGAFLCLLFSVTVGRDVE